MRPASAANLWTQQGTKLIGAGPSGSPKEGSSVAISADGNTAILGGLNDNNFAGAAWVFVRNNGVWTQQGDKLFGSGAAGVAQQGSSVALSADGNTAIVGGGYDNSSAGAAWVFVRRNGVWSQQGGKLVGTGASNQAQQGSSVALSADGNTAIIGGPADLTGDAQTGAAWVFGRSSTGVWSQQGGKLVGTGVVGAYSGGQGNAVALSADGNTAIVGGVYDDIDAYPSTASTGAAWVFRRSPGTWSQFGNKLVGTGAIGKASQGYSVALSGDGKTAAIGGFADNGFFGATWVFVLSGSTWTQQGGKLTGATDYNSKQGRSVSLSSDGDTLLVGGNAWFNGVGTAWLFRRVNGSWSQSDFPLIPSDSQGASAWGWSAALSSDGSTALLGGPGDNSSIGAASAWVRKRPHDFNFDGKSDILWRNTAGDVVQWQMIGASVSAVASLGNVATTWSIVGQRDFSGNGTSDILWRNSRGDNVIWFMNYGSVTSASLISGVATNWYVAGTADVDGDGKGDIIWRNSDGTVAVWLMNGGTVTSVAVLGTVATNWTIYSTADFNGDGKADILWRNTAGNNAIWFMNGTAAPSVSVIGSVAPNWTPVATADFNGDGNGDILWRNSEGSNAIWFMNGASVSVSLIGGVGTSWYVASAGDYDGDGRGDILWREAGGSTAVWFMNGATVKSVANLGVVATNWSIQNAGAN